MARFLFFWIFLVIGLVNRAQHLNHARQINNDRIDNLTSIGSKFYYTVNSSSYNSNARVVATDSLGNELSNYVFGASRYGQMLGLKKTMYKDLIFLARSTLDCQGIYAPIEYTKYFARLDKNLNFLFSVPISIGNQNSYFALPMTQHADSSFYLLEGSNLLHVSKTGYLLPSIPTGTLSLWDIEGLPNGNLLVSGPTGLREITMNLNTVNQSNLSGGFIRSETGKVLSYSGPQLCMLNSNLQTYTCSSSVLPPGYNFVGIDFRNDSLAILASDVSGMGYYALLNSSLSVLSDSYTAVGSNFWKGIALNNGARAMVIADFSWQGNNSRNYQGIFNFPVNGTCKANSDIGIISANVGAVTTYSWGPYHTYLQADFEVQVKNNGPDTLKNFRLNHVYESNQCFDEMNASSHSITLAPGATGSVTTTVYTLKQLWPPVFQTYNLVVCLVATLPNDKIDVNPYNNEYCFPLQLTAGLAEGQIFQNDLQVFPNPFNSELTVNSKKLLKEIQIINALGQKVLEVQVNSRELKLNTETLSKGIYFLVIQTEKDSGIMKLIKD